MDRETGEPVLHPELKQGDLVTITGAYRTRTRKDSKGVEHTNHEVAINGAHQLRRLPSVKRMSYAEARKLLAAKTAKAS
jgi:single-stranded DNA-binding protein